MMLKTKRFNSRASKRKKEMILMNRAVIKKCSKSSDFGFKSTAITGTRGADKRLNF